MGRAKSLNVPWTVITVNWSLGKTSHFIFNGSQISDDARIEFENSHPGESILALVRGWHDQTTVTYPLTYPRELLQKK